MDSFELESSIVTNSLGQVQSYTANTDAQFSVNSLGDVSISIEQGFIQENLFIRVGTTTTYTDK